MDPFLPLLLSSLLSLEELRFRGIAEQAREASCGPAALASLLGVYRGLAVDESSFLPFARADGRIDLAGLVEAARAAGLRAAAIRAAPGDLPSLEEGGWLPCLVHYDRPRSHFAVLLSVDGAAGGSAPVNAPPSAGARAAGTRGLGEALLVLADPARGLEVLDAEAFLRRWSGALLVLERGEPSPREASRLAELRASALAARGRLESGVARRGVLP